MEDITWTDKLRNDKVEKAEEMWCLVYIISKRKTAWTGHIVWRIGLLKMPVEVRVPGKACLGQP